MDLAQLRQLVSRSPRILVVGDLMLDEYVWGEVSRISPEAPVPVLHGRSREFKAGGAGSVVENLAVLGARPQVCGVVGDDEGGRLLRDMFTEREVPAAGVVVSTERPTTRKTRFMAYVQQAHRAQQQIQRVDWEDARELSQAEQASVLEALDGLLAEPPDVVLISDYEKGLVTASLVEHILERVRAARIPVLVDPGRSVDYARYRGATLLCPNRFEAETACGSPLSDVAGYQEAGRRLIETLGLDMVTLTLDREGVYLITAAGEGRAFPTRVRQVTDVAGAGDMVLSLLGLGLASGWPIEDAIALANLGAGIEASKVGVTPVEPWELEVAFEEAGLESVSKVRSEEDLLRIIERQRAAGSSVVFTNGCFDFLHCGHLLLLEKAAALGDVLVLALNSDASIRRLKGSGRPVFPGEERARLLSPYPWIDHIVFFDGATPQALIERLLPDILVKGDDYRDKVVVGREVVEAHGGRVVLVPLEPRTSTTAVLERIRRSEG